MTRIMLVDDHKILREGLKALLKSVPDLKVVTEAEDGREAITKAKRYRPDVIVMDITMPGMGGLEATRKITTLLPQTRVIVLSMHSSEELVREAITSGAVGYLRKESAGQELVKAIHSVLKGETYLDEKLHKGWLDELKNKRESNNADCRLTPREREILQLIAEGKKNKVIANILNLSVKTVETHRFHIMQKFGFRNVVELTRFAIRSGLASLD
ncbi:MAG: response regulator transcription factor [candidate division WOR-3 bacterium]